ncbi:MAG TPA: VWA domain-containing protein [Bryobacteraceae bacterium]|nr:VWA domain-containing protein [Bryobacteraceae bacterium]
MAQSRAAVLLAMACGMLAIPPGEPQNNPPAAPGPAIRATANQVALDLVVRDKKGRLVKNLKPGDVEIYEDGVRQQILSFRMVTGGSAATATTVPGAPAAGALNVLPIPLRSTNLVCIVFHNLDSQTRKWGVEAAQEFIKDHVPPGTWVGVFNLDSRLTPLQPFTTNRDALLRAASNAFTGSSVDIARAAEAVLNSTPNVQLIQGFVAPGGRSGGAQDLSTTGSVSMAAITGADVDNGPGANSQRGDLVIQREQFIGIEGARQMDQMNLLIRQIGTFPGHKTVLLLSSGFTSTGDPDQFQAMLNKANATGITVYAADANGLSQNSTAQASTIAMQHVSSLSQQQSQLAPGEGSPNTTATGAGGVMMERMRQQEYQRDAVRTSDPQASLRALAEGTGGFLIANTNDVAKPLQRIIEDVNTYYEADYHPTSGKYDGRFRKIEVKLARADLRVESRDGYFAIPDVGGPLLPFEMAGLMTLNARPQPHAFDFQTAAYQFRPAGGEAAAAVLFELPASGLTATPEPAFHKHRIHASLFAVVKDSAGNIVDRFGRDFPYQIPDAQLSGIQAMPIDYTHTFRLPPGRYTVESVLLDRESRRASTSTLEFEDPQPKGVGLSSIVLVRRADPITEEPEEDDPFVFHDRKLIPALREHVKASPQPLLYFVVYPDRSLSERVRIRVEFSVGGQELAEKQMELPAPDSSGAIPMLVKADARPGKCQIKITALQGFESDARTVAYTVDGP